MAKYRSQAPNPSRSFSSAKAKDTYTEEDKKQERKFFQIAIIVTLAVIGLIYFMLN